MSGKPGVQWFWTSTRLGRMSRTFGTVGIDLQAVRPSGPGGGAGSHRLSQRVARTGPTWKSRCLWPCQIGSERPGSKDCTGSS